MVDFNNIPHLKIVRNRVYYPESNKGTKQALIFNVSTPKEIGGVMNSNSNLIHMNKYNRYYVQNNYKTKIFNRQVMENLFGLRQKMFEEAKSSFNMLRIDLEISPVTKALVVDMSKWNQLYEEHIQYSYSYRQRYETYIEILKLVLRDTKLSDFNKTMIIDIEKWGSFEGNLGNYRFLDTPLLILYYTLWKDWKLFKSLGDVDIILTSSKGIIRINPALVGQDSFRELKIELTKLSNTIQWDDLDKVVHKSDISQGIKSAMPRKYNLVGDTSDKVDKAIDEIDKKVATKNEESGKSGVAYSDVFDNEAELSKAISDQVIKTKSEQPTLSKRDEKLREEQRDLKLKGVKFSDIIANQKGEIPSRKIERDTINENVKNIRFPNFHKTYNEDYLEHDMLNMVMVMNEAQIPVFVRDIKVEDTSNEMTFKETYTISLEDANRVRHSLTFDMPKFVDDKFLYINGNRKVINNQLLLKPIIKTKEDEVQVVSNYNKIFLRRYGTKLSQKTEKLRKTFIESPNVKRGNNTQVNTGYMTTIEYDDISRNFTYIKAGTSEIYFKQQVVHELAKERNIKVPDDKLLIGFEGRTKPILVDIKTQMIGDMDIVDYIISKSSKDVQTKFSEVTTGKKFLYTRATIMAKDIPLILLLGYCEGLSVVLRKAEIKHYFTDKRPKLEAHEGMVQFADGYLVYDMYPFENSLLMNAFADVATKGFNYADLDGKEAYASIFEVMYNQRNLVSAFDNFYDFMIDPITKEVLAELDYPTDFVGVMLYANKLMADNAFVNENDLSLYRIRSNELVNVFLYKAITDAYGEYRRTAYNNNPTKISIRKDHVLKSLLMAQTVEDYSVLNPRLMGLHVVTHVESSL